MNGANGVGNSSVLNKIDAERQAQRSYWTEHSVETTLEAMMLDSQAKAIDLEERPEVSVLSVYVFDQPLVLRVVATRFMRPASPNLCVDCKWPGGLLCGWLAIGVRALCRCSGC